VINRRRRDCWAARLAGIMRLHSYRRREEAQSAEQRTIKRRRQRGYTTI
jgi:hypothetical protein